MRFATVCMTLLCTLPLHAAEFWESPFGGGVNGAGGVYTIAVKGNEIFIGGTFDSVGGVAASCVAKWDGTAWSSLGAGIVGLVHNLTVIGNDVYAVGDFRTAGGQPANCVAKWDGTTWSALNGGFASDLGTPQGFSGCTDGVNLYVGGSFKTVGGVPASGVAKWDGTNWSAVGTGIGDAPYALAYDNGVLYAGGHGLFRFDGTTWTNIADVKVIDPVFGNSGGYIAGVSIAGNNIYIGGQFSEISGVSCKGVARFDGSAWNALGTGIDIASNSSVPGVFGVLAVNEKVYVGGSFESAGGGIPTKLMAIYDGTTWSTVEGGLSGVEPSVRTFVLNNGKILVGGEFSKAGKVSAGCIAQLTRASVAPKVTVAPNPALLADILSFSTSVPSGATATWDFGDGTTADGAAVTKIYSAAGVYTVTVTIIDQGLTTVGATTVLVNAAPPSGGSENVFNIEKAQVSLNFQKSGSDSLKLSGLLPVEVGTVAENTTVTLRVGQLTQAYTLTAKANAGDSTASVKLSTKLDEGKFTVTPAKFSISLKKALVGALQPLGFDNADVSAKSIELPVVLTIGQVNHLDLVTVTYNAKARKTGKAK